MEVRILGPLDVRDGEGRTVVLPAGRERSLLALLVIRHGEVVSIDRIVDALWGGTPPGTAAKAVQGYVSHLRRALEPEREPGDGDSVLVTRPPGYALRQADMAVDAVQFERLASEGRRSLEDGSAGEAARLLEDGLALWRGQALVEFAFDEFAQDEIRRLEELRLSATEDRFESLLRLGRHAEIAGQLDVLVRANPLRERLRGQLMLALYRSGRQADALQVYREGRRLLAAELGLDPGPELQRLERAILAQDQALELGDARSSTPIPPSGDDGSPAVSERRPRRALVWVVAAAAAIAALAIGLGLPFRGGDEVVVVSDSVVKIDAESNRIVDSIPVGGQPGQVRVLGDAVFVTSMTNKTLSRIDARTGELTTSGEYAAGPGIAVGDDWLWVASERRDVVTRVSPRSLGEIEQIRLGGRPGDLERASVALGGGSLWVSQFAPAAVTRWNLETHLLERRYELGGAAVGEIIFGERAAWVPLFSASVLLRIDAATGSTTRIPVGAGPTDPVMGFGSVWVTSMQQGTVWRLEPFTGQVQQVIAVGRAPFGLAVGAGSVWVTDYCGGTVARIDPETNEVVARIETGHIPRWLAVGAGHAWVGVAGEDTFDATSAFPRCKGSSP